MKIRCLIERAGPTTVMYAGMRFDFIPNKHGHCVCEVNNPGAVEYFLKTLAGYLYETYVPPAEEQGKADVEGVKPAASLQKTGKVKAATGARARAKNRMKATAAAEEQASTEATAAAEDSKSTEE